MEIEQAIKSIGNIAKYWAPRPTEREAAELALTSLKEKQERAKGCEYCRERKPLLNEIGSLQIDDIDKSLWFTCQTDVDDIYEEHTDIKFCPMCGRDLEESK